MSDSIPLIFVDAPTLKAEYDAHAPWFDVCQFSAKPGTHCLLPDPESGIKAVLLGRPKSLDTWTLATLATSLPPRTYHLADKFTPEEATKLGLGWHLSQYRFDRYQQKKATDYPQLTRPDNADGDYITAAVAAAFLVRDLVNTPANDMGPAELEAVAQSLADTYGATMRVVTGEALQQQNYPLIYAVGQASDRPPRLIDFTWGDPSHPAITLVGKGVCFDSGGLNVKSFVGMKLMKKDMGGAAHVLGVALMLMKLKIPVYLRVLVAAVENSIAGNANRPLDIVPSRKGTTVEIGNTDAEGRLVLADALWDACEVTPSPTLVVDFATLTGAARVALGTEVPVFFSTDQENAIALQRCSEATDDLMWQLPLHQPYRSFLDSKAADLSNIGSVSQGGAITAALFLQEFVAQDIPWIHIDVMAWNSRSRPGRPEGGAAMGLRAVFELIKGRSLSAKA
ncbi:MAG: leucyl aminopeptidase family protein [Cyanothece sp. SIO2G6]|nr:leucyl aminopeptidase family protein [Cyanothece sp. SIO2G6]